MTGFAGHPFVDPFRIIRLRSFSHEQDIQECFARALRPGQETYKNMFSHALLVVPFRLQVFGNSAAPLLRDSGFLFVDLLGVELVQESKRGGK